MTPGAGVRAEFPALARRLEGGRPLTYLDSAATSLRPRVVIERVSEVMALHAANVHRSVHVLGDEATQIYEGARRRVAFFLNAEAHEIVFTRNTTESLNLVARAYPVQGDVVTSLTDHHSALLPWSGRVLQVPPLPDARVDVEALERRLAAGGVGLVIVSWVSNVTGIGVDVARVSDAARRAGAVLVVDAAQAAPHRPIDVQALGCDFLAFSGHKLGAPGGIGVLYGRADRLAEMTWFLKGGATVEAVHDGVPEPRAVPWRFEAGTPPVEATAGLARALDFLDDVGLDAIARHQRALVAHLLRRLDALGSRVALVGPRDVERAGPVSITVRGMTPHQVARVLSDAYGICVRSGFLCAQPLHESLGLPASLRISPWMYTVEDELDRCVDAIGEVLRIHAGGA